jgi:predicted Zn-dependent protease
VSVREFPGVAWLRTGISTLALAAFLAAPATATRAQGEAFTPGIERDTEIEAILHDLMDPVFVAANTNPSSVELYMVGDPTLNAATLPGHRIIVNSGLIMQCDNPNELEGVLAHETGHMERGDDARYGEATKGIVGPMLLGLGLGVLAALAGAPDAAAGLIYSGQ